MGPESMRSNGLQTVILAGANKHGTGWWLTEGRVQGKVPLHPRFFSASFFFSLVLDFFSA